MRKKTVTKPESVASYLEDQSKLDLLRFITCGSVDDGKSTLIGRLLFEAQSLFDDQVAALDSESKKYGTQGKDVDFALLVDGLSAEREQGITIDVAYRFFQTDARKFIVADTPGHVQYTRNMVTGASTADVAVILVDARQGILEQTKRHAFLVHLLGVRHAILAVNKMDLVGFDQATFDSIEADFAEISKELGHFSFTAIPVSALQGDNMVKRSSKTKWYQGPTLLGQLESMDVAHKRNVHGALLPVQYVNRSSSDFRGFAGTIEGGMLSVGDDVRVLPKGTEAKIKDIVTYDGNLSAADAGKAVTLVLDREVDASRGEVISKIDHLPEAADQFACDLVWMVDERGYPGRPYILKLATVETSVTITKIEHRVDMETFGHESADELGLNDISYVHLKTDKPIVFTPYKELPALGAFILIDRYSNLTIAAGMIRHALRRSNNIHYHDHEVGRGAREELNGHKGQVLWFTGLSGSGKSTIADKLERKLHQKGMRTFLLDGDNVRHGLNSDLGFTDADRVENIRRVAEISKLMRDAGLVVLAAFISPFRAEREMAKEIIGEQDFIEIFVDIPLEIAEARDPKGLYKKARAGLIPNFTGIGSAYETPTDPDLHLHSNQKSVDDLVLEIEAFMDAKRS